MPYPNDMRPDGTCRVCGDRRSRVIRKRTGRQAFRRHLTNPDCETKGEGEPMSRMQRTTSGGGYTMTERRQP